MTYVWRNMNGVVTIVCADLDHEDANWCDCLQEALREGDKDQTAGEVAPEQTYLVPIFPRENLWVEVEIGDTLHGRFAPMRMHHQPDLGRKFEVDLGIWNDGEGLTSIASVVWEWIKGQCNPRESFKGDGAVITSCPSSSHGLRAQRILANPNKARWRLICLWNIVMEKACTVCIEESGPDTFKIDPDALANVPSWRKP